MHEYSSTEARQDALRAISDNLFMVCITYKPYTNWEHLWLIVIAENKDLAIESVAIYAASKKINPSSIVAFPTLNAIEETIK